MFKNWQWLAGTYWYVPGANLSAPSFSSDRERPLWLVDQTVWQIIDYRDGYFWGNVAALLIPADSDDTGATPTAQRVMASVTPEGNLHMTFVPVDQSGDQSSVLGIGNMRWQDGSWAAEMQMSTVMGAGSYVLHWAYMRQCVPGDAAWEQLPGTDQSLPEFMAAAGFSVDG